MNGSAIPFWKRAGETPLAALERFRKERALSEDVPLTYAGRLDPMAGGILLVLAGEEAKNRAAYLALPKEYRVAVLFGIATDSYDALGLVEEVHPVARPEVEVQAARILRSMQKRFLQAYPPYSSKPVNGTPLYQWAREGRIREVDIPKHEVEIYRADIERWESRSNADVLEFVRQRVRLVVGDFRQEEIVERWEASLGEMSRADLPLLWVRIACSSGTYMRGVAHDLGRAVGCGAIAYAIERIAVGPYRGVENTETSG